MRGRWKRGPKLEESQAGRCHGWMAQPGIVWEVWIVRYRDATHLRQSGVFVQDAAGRGGE